MLIAEGIMYTDFIRLKNEVRFLCCVFFFLLFQGIEPVVTNSFESALHSLGGVQVRHYGDEKHRL